jgi:hypothetical protein
MATAGKPDFVRGSAHVLEDCRVRDYKSVIKEEWPQRIVDRCKAIRRGDAALAALWLTAKSVPIETYGFHACG